MKRFLAGLFCAVLIFCGCSPSNTDVSDVPRANTEKIELLKKGDQFSLAGEVGYSDSPSDIGQEYCEIKLDKKIEYYYTDIYGKTSKWSSDVFYTKGKDTDVLRAFVGRRVTVFGKFEAEAHGIPYITDIKVDD